MTSWHTLESLSIQILEPLSYISGIAEILATGLRPLIYAGLVITVMIYGYKILYGGMTNNIFLELFFTKLMRPALIIALVFSGSYTTYIVDTVEMFRTDLMGIFTTTSADNSYAIIDQSMDKVMQTFYALTDTALTKHIKIVSTSPDLSGVLMILSAGVMVLALLCYATVAAAELLLIDVGMKVLLAFGPLFFATLMFPAFSRFFDGWLSTVLKLVMMAVTLMIVVGIGTGILDNYATKLLANVGFLEYMKVAFSSIAASILLIYFTKKLPSIIGDMMGGGGLSLGNSAGAAGKAMSGIASAAGSAAGGAARGAAHMAGNTARGAALADKVTARAEKFSNSGAGHLMRAVAGSNGGVGKSFQAGADRHTKGKGSITGSGDRPQTPPT